MERKERRKEEHLTVQDIQGVGNPPPAFAALTADSSIVSIHHVPVH
jgi:hypothetical protein